MASQRYVQPDLLERAIGGDESARHALLDFYRNDLVRMAQSRLDRRIGVRVDASDIVQDALIDAWRRLDVYLQERPLPLLPWLRQIVGERIIDTHRRHISSQRRAIHREEAIYRAHDSEDRQPTKLLSNESSPINQLVRQETKLHLETALQALSKGDRELLVMRHLEHLTSGEIATRLGVTEGAVKARLLRALIRLRGQMKVEL